MTGAEYCNQKRENKSGSHRAVNDQLHLLKEYEYRNAGIVPDEQQSRQQHQVVDRFAERLSESVDGYFEKIEHFENLLRCLELIFHRHSELRHR